MLKSVITSILILGSVGIESHGQSQAPVAKKQVVLFLGDSLTAGYGILQDEAYPALLQERWNKEGLSVEVRNGGVSGVTTAGALENLDWVLTSDVDIVFLELGANDGLRGLSVNQTRNNLEKIIAKIRSHRVRVVLAGMKVPPNYGGNYSRQFERMYPELAKKYHLKLMPFFLEGVAGKPQYNIQDGIHPNPAGQKIVAKNVRAFFAKEHILK